MEYVEKTLENHERRITKNESDISGLKITDGKLTTYIENLAKSIDNLSSWIKTFIIVAFTVLFAIAGAGLTFIIWYIQKG